MRLELSCQGAELAAGFDLNARIASIAYSTRCSTEATHATSACQHSVEAIHDV
jgi:hypothetical protein